MYSLSLLDSQKYSAGTTAGGRAEIPRAMEVNMTKLAVRFVGRYEQDQPSCNIRKAQPADTQTIAEVCNTTPNAESTFEVIMEGNEEMVRKYFDKYSLAEEDDQIDLIIRDLGEDIPAVANVTAGMMGGNDSEKKRTLIVEAGPQHGMYMYKGYMFQTATTAGLVGIIIRRSRTVMEARESLKLLKVYLSDRA